MVKSIKTEAIVLKKKNLPSNDVLITFLTQDFGKVATLAKGARSLNSRRQPHLQTGNLIGIMLHESKERYYLQETVLISAFSQIKSNDKKIGSVYFFLHIIDRLLPEQEPEPRIYEHTKQFLANLSRSTDIRTDLLERYLNEIMRILGYIEVEKTLPQLHKLIEELTNEKIPLFII